MDIISWTPAGRAKYLDLLIPNIKKIRNQLKKHVFYINTCNESDIEYIKNICRKDNFFTYVVQDNPNGLETIGHAYEQIFTNKTDLYLRLDDDICYIDTNLIDSLLGKLGTNFFVMPFVVNNSICSFLYQHFFECYISPTKYECLDDDLWRRSEFGTLIHNLFLENKIQSNVSKIPDWILMPGERVSVNCFLMSGYFGQKISYDIKQSKNEEAFLTNYCKENTLISKIITSSIVSHYSYHTQQALHHNHDLFNLYKRMCKNDCFKYLI